MKRTCGGNLRLLEKRWFKQPMFSNPPKIKLGGKRRRKRR